MKNNQVKKLKCKIKELEEENQFLQIGIETREDAHNLVSEQRDKAMMVTQELTILLIYMEAMANLLKDEDSYNSRIIRKAIGIFKKELSDGFAENHLITQLNNNNDYNDI